MTAGVPPRWVVPVGAGWARERLWLGMTDVGVWVVLALVAVGWGAPSLGGGRWDAVGWAALGLAIQLPFDVIGGLVLPRRHGRATQSAARWWWGWGRAALAHGLLTAAALASATALYTVGGAGLAWLGAALGVVGLVGLQGPWLWLTTGRRTRALDPAAEAAARAAGLEPARVKTVEASDGGFAGAWVGLPGFETLVIPRAWTDPDRAGLLDVQLARRAAAVRTGQRARGVALGVSWTLLGVAAGLLVFGAAEPADAVRAAALSTLWSFVGLLVLPTPSRRGVLAVDAAALRAGVAPAAFAAAARQHDQAQEDEPERGAVVESIFHPVPALQHRLKAAESAAATGGAWTAARMALLASQAVAGPLGRAVHCNAGRPELWAVYPGD